MVDAFMPALFFFLLIEPTIGEHCNARGENTGEQMRQ